MSLDGEVELFLFASDGRSPRKLSGTLVSGGTVNRFEIAPNGRRVAYMADQDTDTVRELYVADIDGSGIVKINPPMIADGDVHEFAWSADSTQIVYLADAEQFDVREVYLANADGSNVRKINSPVVGPATVDFRDIEWSPDGRYVSQVVRHIATDHKFAIDNYDTRNLLNTRITPMLTAGGAIQLYRWAPDASRVAYLADQDTTISSNSSAYCRMDPGLSNIMA